MLKQKKIAILILAFIGFFQSTPVLAHWSQIPGSTFPNTCAASMDFVPEGDASWDKHNEGKSYVFSEKYKNAVSAWQTANLTSVTIANVSKDHLGLPIYVHKDAATAFTNFGNDLLNCEEIKQGLYPIEIFDNFACRLITKGKVLSPHASGYAVDINVNENEYTTTACKTNNCDFSPCFLAALKKNGLSWGGPGDPILFPGKCDTQHIQWTSNKTNIRESDLNFCSLKPEIAALYGAGTVLPTGQTVQSVTIDTGIPLINEVNLILEKPTPKISIPGLNFSEIKSIDEDGGKFLYIPFLGEYIAAIYKYGVIIASIFAVVMIINAGFGWAISGGEPEKINHAKTRIGQAMMGLFLAVASYAILYIINPDLVKFRSLRVQYIPGIPLSGEEGLQSIVGADNPTMYDGPISAGQAGQWRFEALNNCGNKQGLSLTTKADKQARLKSVVQLWKNLAIDQGAGLYIHGGGLDCSPNLGGQNLIYTISSIYKDRPSAVPPTFLSTSCGQTVATAAGSFVIGPGAYYKNKTLAGQKLNASPNSAQCEKDLLSIYKLLLSEPAKKNGLMCGDCGSFLLSLYRCFDNRIESNNTRRFIFEGKFWSGADKDAVRFQTQLQNIITNPSAYLSKLEFGDIINWYRPDVGGNHYFLYTGKAGLGFEIIEMGAAGSATPDQNSAKDAFTKIGLYPPYSGSGVRAFKSAQDYLTKLGGKTSTITAFGIVDQKNILQ